MAELKMEVILQAFDRVTSVLGGIDGSISKTKRNINDYKKRLRELNDTVPKEGFLTAQQKKDQAELKKTERLIERQQKRLKDLYKMQTHRNQGKQMMGAGAMHIAAATAMGYGASRLMSEGAEFEETMSRVQALTRLEKGSDALMMLQKQAEDLGESTWATAKQAAEGQAFYAMAGFKPEDIINAMPSTLHIAKAGGLEIDRAADISSNILSAFKIPASELGKVADSLVATFTRTNTDMEMLGQTMKYVAPVAQSLGMSLEESLAMTGLLGNIGIQSDQAGTALRKIEQRLAAPPAGAKKALDKLGIKTKDEKGNLRNMAIIFQELFERTKEMGSADRTKYLTAISGLEASAAMSEFTSSDFYNNYIGLLSEIESAHKRGEAAFVAGTMSDNLLGDIEQLSSGWSRFRQIIFQTNSKGLRETTKWLTKIMSNINAFTKENPEIVRNLSFVAAGVMGITTALGLAKLAWGAFQFAVLGNPIAASLAVIGVSIYAIYKNLDKWLWLWTDGFGQLQKDIDGLLRSVPLVGNHLGNVWLILSNGVKTVVDALGFLVDLVFDFDNAWLKVVSTWDDFTMNVQRFWNDIVTWAQPAVDKIMKILQPFLDAYYAIVGKQNTELANEMHKNAQIEEKYGVSSADFHNLSQDEQAAMLNAPANTNTGTAEEQRAEVMRMMGGNHQQVKNKQTNTFQIHITAPDGNAQSIADAVKRGIASVTQKNGALLGDQS